LQLEKLCVILRTSIEFSYITIHDCCKSFTNLFEISCLIPQLTKQQEISNGAVSPEDLFPEVNLPVYTFENRCREMPELALGDEAYKIFLNAGGNAEGMSKGLAAFLRYIRTNEATDAFTQKLDSYVRRAVEHKEWRLEYMTLQQKYREEYEAGVQDGIEQGIEQGIERGREQGLQTTAVRLFRMQMPVEQIAQAVGEETETVEKWLAEEGER